MKVAMVALLLAVSIVSAQESHNFEVRGYGSGDSRLDHLMESNLQRWVVSPISQALQSDEGARVKIEVTGYADKDKIGGNIIQNNSLAKDRAEEVRSFLSGKFPQPPSQIQINIHSKGDEANKRMAVVSWDIVPGSKNATAKWQTLILRGMATLLFLVIIGRLLFWRPKPQQTIPPVAMESTSATVSDTTEWIEAEGPNREAYSVALNFQDGKWLTPFLSLKEPRQPVVRDTRHDAFKAIRGCVAREVYSAEIKELIAAGKIKRFGN